MRKHNSPATKREPCPDGPASVQAASAKSILNGSDVDTVRERAYQIFETRVSHNFAGDPMSDWLQAEEQVRLELARGKDILA